MNKQQTAIATLTVALFMVSFSLTRIFSGANPDIVLHKPVINDVTATRALDTTYQNTCGRPMLVVVSIVCVRANVLNAEAYVNALVGPLIPSTTAAVGGLFRISNEPDQLLSCLTIVVPEEYYYRATSVVLGVGSSVTLDRWIEITL